MFCTSYKTSEIIYFQSKFSTCNLYYIGLTLHATGKKEEAIKGFIEAYKAHAHNEHEIKVCVWRFISQLGYVQCVFQQRRFQARALAKGMLLKLKVDPKEYAIEEY